MSKQIKYIGIFLCLLAIVLGSIYFLNSEEQDKRQKEDPINYVIGVSQANLTEPWRITMMEEIKLEASQYKDMKLIVRDAAMSTKKQIKDVEDLMNYDIDLLIISPKDSEELTPIVAKCYEKIPVIVLDRAVEGYDYTLYIGPDNYLIGHQAGEFIAELLPDQKGKVLEIQGLYGSPPVVDRSQGLKEVLSMYPDINITKTIYGDWLRDSAEDLLREMLRDQEDFDIIFAHNDEMALGAIRAIEKKRGSKGEIKIIGVDGLEGKLGGISLVQQDLLDGTFNCRTGGQDAVRYAVKILKGEKGIPKKMILRSEKITKEVLGQEDQKVKEDIAGGTIRLGFVQVGSESNWRVANSNSIKISAAEEDIELIFLTANQSQQKQIAHIRKLIEKKVDVIAFSPVVETGWEEILREIKEAGIPVILSDRSVQVSDASLYTTFIGADFEEEGRRAANWIVNHLEEIKQSHKPISIVEIQGTLGAGPVIGREKGFRQVIEAQNQIEVLDQEPGEFTVEGGKLAMERLLNKYGTSGIDFVYAHNDDMAIGAIEAIEGAGIRPGVDIKIVSVDGTKEAFQAMIKGKLNCSVECNPLLGPVLMHGVKDLVKGKTLPLRIITEEQVFTQKNAKSYLHKREY